MRDTSPEWQSQAQRLTGARVVRYFEADFGDVAGIFRAWTQSYDTSWNNVTWSGGGEILEVGPIRESADRQRHGLTVRLPPISAPLTAAGGVTEWRDANGNLIEWRNSTNNALITWAGGPTTYARDTLTAALTAEIGRFARLWMGWLEEDGDLAADPVCMFAGEVAGLDIQMQDDGGYAIEVQCEQELRDLDRSSRYRMTSASQVKIDPTDKGFSFLPTLERRPAKWGPRYYSRVKED